MIRKVDRQVNKNTTKEKVLAMVSTFFLSGKDQYLWNKHTHNPEGSTYSEIMTCFKLEIKHENLHRNKTFLLLHRSKSSSTLQKGGSVLSC